MKRIVFDSTTLVSAFLTADGPARKLLTRVSHEGHQLILCDTILVETARALLTYSRIRKRYVYLDDATRQYLGGIEAVAVIVHPQAVEATSRDPNDDVILGCAYAGKAEIIVTRDKDLLVLTSINGVAIVTPEAALALLAS